MEFDYVIVGQFDATKYDLKITTTTNDVVLTMGQLEHIADKHPEVLKYLKKIKYILSDPDVVLKENKMIDTIWLIKEFDNNVKITLRLNTIKHGLNGFKNSIIQMQYLEDERIQKYLLSDRVSLIFEKQKVL